MLRACRFIVPRKSVLNTLQECTIARTQFISRKPKTILCIKIIKLKCNTNNTLHRIRVYSATRKSHLKRRAKIILTRLRIWLHKWWALIIPLILSSSKIRPFSTLLLLISRPRSYSSKITGRWYLKAIKKCKRFLQSRTFRKCHKFKWDRFQVWARRLSRPWKQLSNSLKWENNPFTRVTKQSRDNPLVNQTRATELKFHTKARRVINLLTRRTISRKSLNQLLF